MLTLIIFLLVISIWIYLLLNTREKFSPFKLPFNVPPIIKSNSDIFKIDTTLELDDYFTKGKKLHITIDKNIIQNLYEKSENNFFKNRQQSITEERKLTDIKLETDPVNVQKYLKDIIDHSSKLNANNLDNIKIIYNNDKFPIDKYYSEVNTSDKMNDGRPVIDSIKVADLQALDMRSKIQKDMDDKKRREDVLTNFKKLFPFIKELVETKLNTKQVIENSKTDTDYIPEPFQLGGFEIIIIFKDLDVRETHALIDATLYRKNKYFVFNTTLEITFNDDNRIQINDIYITSFSPSEDSPQFFKKYKMNLLKDKECVLNADTTLPICQQTYQGTPRDFFKTIKNNDDRYFRELSGRCIGKTALNRDKCVSKDRNGKMGIWGELCKLDSDCPYFKANKNYKNERGGCLPNGYCELPYNMEHYDFKTAKKDLEPLCHNCPKNKNCMGVECSQCCDSQEIPDYAFENDTKNRLKYKKELAGKGLKVRGLFLGEE